MPVENKLAQHEFGKTVEKKFYYSEIFHSIQGEGHYTGVPTAWIRFFLCNLQCNGFGQIGPTNPDTYELPFHVFDNAAAAFILILCLRYNLAIHKSNRAKTKSMVSGIPCLDIFLGFAGTQTLLL